MTKLSIGSALLVAALLAVAAPAQATLVFSKGQLKRSVWVANDDGSAARKLASNGSGPRIAPDGRTVVFDRIANERPNLMVVPADGSGPARTLAPSWRGEGTLAWSPDSRTIATIVGPELNARKLVLIDVATGAQRVVATGFFSGVSFSPPGDQIVFARSATDRYPLRSDLYSAFTAAGSPAPTRLTNDHVSGWALWGPTDRIVFVRLIDAAKRKYGPKNELYTI